MTLKLYPKVTESQKYHEVYSLIFYYYLDDYNFCYYHDQGCHGSGSSSGSHTTHPHSLDADIVSILTLCMC